jgi:hypothetical protein
MTPKQIRQAWLAEKERQDKLKLENRLKKVMRFGESQTKTGSRKD